jgi:hypothetical protein
MDIDLSPDKVSLSMVKLSKNKLLLNSAVLRYIKALSGQPSSKRQGAIPTVPNSVADPMAKYETMHPVFEELTKNGPESGDARYHLACLYARKGMVRDAAVQLEEAIRSGFSAWDLIKSDLDLEAFRKTPMYTKLIEKFAS